MMKEVFDPVETIYEMISSFVSETGRVPSAVVVSRNTYRRLLEIGSSDCKIGNVHNGSEYTTVIATPWGRVGLIIDEILEDTRIEVAG